MEELYIAIRTTLLAASPVTALVSQRISKHVAGQVADRPYITYYISAGGYEIESNDDQFVGLVTVEAWADDNATAAQVFAAARNALHRAEFSVTGWDNLWCMLESIYDLPPDIYNGNPLYRMAGDYRIHLVKQ